ncbi:MAG: VanZ family protein [Lachnospiraceae bacterium]|nr:VanZ family protein [Lachnospiraceae bacterium]
MRRKIFIVLTIIWMVVIFTFSAKNADESGQDSYMLGHMIGKIVITDFEDLPAEEQLAFAEKIDYPIRKAAHVTEYAILGFFVMGAIYSSRMRWYIQALIAWTIATLYAASDEFHQRFVPGRSGEFKDVCIDSCGVVIGVVIGLLIFMNFYKKKNETK